MKNAFLILPLLLFGCTERADKTAVAPPPSEVQSVQLNDAEFGAAISRNADLSNFAEALQISGLDSSLLRGPLTIFVPNNAAFEKFGREKFQDLLKPENIENLRDLLKLHIVPGKISARDLREGELTTLEGDDIDVDVDSNGKVTVEGADIIRIVEGSNGIIYVINTVIEP